VALSAPAFARALRPRQWVKNLFVLLPLVFARDIFHPDGALRASGATLIFCLLSGAVYLLNDVCDVADDRAHPVKRHRPIASGELPVPVALAGHAALVAVAVLGGGFWLGLRFGGIAAAYFVVNVAYSLRLKHVAYLDVLLIAAGFVLRVLAGAVAISVPVSPWLPACTLLLALYLGFGKRLHELRTLGVEGEARRRSLLGYGERRLDTWMRWVGMLTALGYLSYTVAPGTAEKFGTRLLAATTPSIVYGLWRFHKLVCEDRAAESPTDRMIRDRPFLANIAVWVVAVVVILYLGSDHDMG